jgi:hypothetical protein
MEPFTRSSTLILNARRKAGVFFASVPNFEEGAAVFGPRLGDDIDHNPTHKILDWRLMIEDW